MVLKNVGFSIPNGVILAKLPHNFLSACALEPLVSLISRFGACSGRTSGDRQTDTQNYYRNPCCVCAPRVNNIDSNLPVILQQGWMVSQKWKEYE